MKVVTAAHGAVDHDHDDFDTFSVEVSDAPGADELIDRLQAAIVEHDVLRVKGFAHVPGRDMRPLIQAVGDRIQHYYDRDWRKGEERCARLVVIGRKGLDEAAVRDMLNG